MIIGLVGFKQVGKSTAAAHLEKQYNFQRHNFKDALVAEMKENFPDLLDLMVFDNGGDPRVEDIDDLFEYKPPLMRALMQEYGTEVRRGDDNNYWVKQWLEKAMEIKSHIVTDDVRFDNEAKAVKGNGGVLIRLDRPDIASGGTHQSETEQLGIECDHTITVEQGDLQGLYRQLDEIVKAYNL